MKAGQSRRQLDERVPKYHRPVTYGFGRHVLAKESEEVEDRKLLLGNAQNLSCEQNKVTVERLFLSALGNVRRQKRQSRLTKVKIRELWSPLSHKQELAKLAISSYGFQISRVRDIIRQLDRSSIAEHSRIALGDMFRNLKKEAEKRKCGRCSPR
jgi:hypothetical protein